MTCDEINSLTFVKNESHETTLNKMKEALAAQTKMIDGALNFPRRLCSHSDEMKCIKSEEEVVVENEDILNNPLFKTDL